MKLTESHLRKIVRSEIKLLLKEGDEDEKKLNAVAGASSKLKSKIQNIQGLDDKLKSPLLSSLEAVTRGKQPNPKELQALGDVLLSAIRSDDDKAVMNLAKAIASIEAGPKGE